MLGVVSKAPKTVGQKIRKPWKVVSTSQSLTETLSAFVCSGDHLHAPCMGVDTLQTGFYTDELASAIISGLMPLNVLANPAVHVDDDSTEKCCA